MNRKKIVGAVVGVLLAFNALAVLAEENGEQIGEYASEVNSTAPMAAGHFALIAHYADAYLSSGNGTGGHRTIFAQALMDGVDDPVKADEITDFFLLDVRKAADYEAGHIAGAVNVQLADVADPGVLAALPTEKPILVICYTGHTASIATGILNVLGYDAWTLRFGMTSWKVSSPTAVWSSSIKQDITGGNYPMVTGSEP